MNLSDGKFVAFADYLERSKRQQPIPVHWKWSEVARALAEFPAGERGSIALSHHGASDCPAVPPGLSVTVQIVAPGGRTRPHAHSFWHLYVVRTGRGLFFTSEIDEASVIATGDLLFVPAWSSHAFANPHADEPLILLATQNLPLVAELGVLARSESGKAVELVYLADGRCHYHPPDGSSSDGADHTV